MRTDPIYSAIGLWYSCSWVVLSWGRNGW